MKCYLKLYDRISKKEFIKEFDCEFDKEKFIKKLRYSNKLIVIGEIYG